MKVNINMSITSRNWAFLEIFSDIMLISYLVKFSIELLNFQESPGISKLLLPAVTFSRWLN